MTLMPTGEWDSEGSLATFYDDRYHLWVDGRETQKLQEDLDRYQEIIDDTDPEVIVEVGTRYGGSALWFHLRGYIKVITIDIANQLNKPQLRADRERGIHHMVGDSTDEAILAHVRGIARDYRTMVSLDGDHHAPKVREEIQKYGALVTPGCFLVVEDACFDMWTGDDSRRGGRSIPEVGGTLKALQLAGMEAHPWWRRDMVIEDWSPLSHSPCGWWERR